jgi:hypothetical protein
VADDRYIVLGLAHPRAEWFTEVARWATSGAAPVEFVKCVSATEAAVRLDSARQFSAALFDAGTTGVDRDLVDLAQRRGCPVIVVGERDRSGLGATASLPAAFDRAALLDALATHARLVHRAEAIEVGVLGPVAETPWRGKLVGVVGSGGVGTSTVAMALAQGLADDVRDAGLVLLADFALRGDLTMFHDVGDVVPGVQELVEAHRVHRPGPADVRSSTFEIVARRYHLVLGLRRHHDWTALRARAFESALDNLRATFHIVVADLDGDVEGDLETGSTDVEDRNLMARTVANRADVLVCVGAPGLKGTFGLHRLVADLQGLGVDAARLLPVLNRAPRSARARAEHSRAFAEIAGPLGLSGPLPLPERRDLEHLHRTAGRMPEALCAPIARAARAMFDRLPSHEAADLAPVPVAPGSLGTWAEEDLTP